MLLDSLIVHQKEIEALDLNSFLFVLVLTKKRKLRKSDEEKGRD